MKLKALKLRQRYGMPMTRFVEELRSLRLRICPRRSLSKCHQAHYPNPTSHSISTKTPTTSCQTLSTQSLSVQSNASYEGHIDYNDQIYMSALFGGTYPKYPLTLVDEYQDLSPVNHEMIRRLVGNRRLIGVGDPNQNIYGFRGAQAQGMARRRCQYEMKPRWTYPSASVAPKPSSVTHGGTCRSLSG